MLYLPDLLQHSPQKGGGENSHNLNRKMNKLSTFLTKALPSHTSKTSSTSEILFWKMGNSFPQMRALSVLHLEGLE